MFKRLSVPFALCLAAFATSSFAGTLPVPTVEYSADRLVETASGSFTGKVYATRDKQRAETNMGSMQSVMILRQDKKVGYMLMPAQHMYRQMDLSNAQKQSGTQPQDQVEITEVGSDTIAGQSTTQYKMIMKDGTAGGFIWVTKDGIPVKMDAVSRDGKEKTRMTMTLTNLKIGPQDPSLFEVPGGYTAMPDFGGMGNMMGGARGAVPGAGNR